MDGAIPPPPAATCDEPATPVDTSHPTAVVGGGTPESCTETELATKVAGGGVITFNCGSAPITITLTSELAVTNDTTIDGGGLVTLSGNNQTRILHIKSAWNLATPLLTVQHLNFTEGFTTDAANTHSTAEGGAAIFEDGGSLTVIDCTFSHNQCAQSGQDVSGGAINGQGVGTLIIQDSVFADNSGSNGGAVGTQDESVTIVNTVFSNNSANGTGGNPGNGGDGGALSYDGAMIPLSLCGDRFVNNRAGAQGGAIFRVAYNDEPSTIDRCTFDGNSSDPTTGLAGAIYLEDTTINLSATTISHNSANFGGGIWVGHAAVARFTNVTIADNTANMGAGVWFAGMVSGTFLNCTIAGNGKDGLFGGDSNIVLENSIVDQNPGHDCTAAYGGIGANMQNALTPGMPCAPNVTVADPMLGMLQDNGGPTFTMLPAATSAAVGKGANCPATDQRGHARPAACTLGAVEPD